MAVHSSALFIFKNILKIEIVNSQFGTRLSWKRKVSWSEIITTIQLEDPLAFVEPIYDEAQ